MVVPSALTQREYPNISALMVHGQPERPNAALAVNPFEEPIGLGYRRYDTGFSSQIDQVEHYYSELDPEIESAPTAYAVTLSSAVPVADAIRSYYHTLGKTCPPIVGINVNSVDGLKYYDDKSPQNLSANHRTHVAKLSSAIQNPSHVCLVEQYVCSGRTLALGGILLRAAGATHVTAIRGKWYGEVKKHTLNLTDLTSEHKDFMSKVGRLSAQNALLQTN